MKKWIFAVLAFLVVPHLTAQKMNYEGGSGGKMETFRNPISETPWFGRVVVYQQSNKEIVRFEIDDSSIGTVRDKDLLQDLRTMASHRYGSTLEALNVLSSRGWSLASTLVLNTNRGEERHYLMSYTVAGKPLSPWLRKDAKGSGGKQ